MASKFKLRDKVVVKGEIPQYFGAVARLHRVRTIAVVYYNKSQQHNLYYLGTNRRGTEFDDYGFRAEQLEPAPSRSIGRPKIRRGYRASSPDTRTDTRTPRNQICGATRLYKPNWGGRMKLKGEGDD